MPSNSKYVKKKPASRPRGGLYKPGEEIKPQRRPQNLFKGMPEVKRSVDRTEAGKASLERNKIRGTKSSKEMMDSRAMKLWMKERNKAASAHRSDLPKEVKQPILSKAAKNMNRLRGAMSEAAAKSAIKAHKFLGRRLGGFGKDLQTAKKLRSPISPAAISAELGMAYLQGSKSKDAKKIKKLRKQAKPV